MNTRVPITSPSVLTLTDPKAVTSWIQVARTGTFHSSKYGKFSITTDDLRQMLHNFTHVTPIAPTQLPVDYDHLSMDPKKPGDGKAAGWFKSMELRTSDTELWAEIAWTPEAAQTIKAGEYRFVSPSFIRDYVWKEGKNIGTTLIAAAITNHPFLEGMAAVTLSTNLGSVAVRWEGVREAMQLSQENKVSSGQLVELVRSRAERDGICFADALSRMAAEQPALFEEWRASITGGSALPPLQPSAPANELHSLATERAAQRGISLQAALTEITGERLDLVEKYWE
jgi:phage I-like protein